MGRGPLGPALLASALLSLLGGDGPAESIGGQGPGAAFFGGPRGGPGGARHRPRMPEEAQPGGPAAAGQEGLDDLADALEAVNLADGAEVSRPNPNGEGWPSSRVRGEETWEAPVLVRRCGRPGFCQGCLRPQKTCICAALPPGAPLETRSRVVLLIHPKEAVRALGTAPLLQLCLQDLVLREGYRFPEPEEDPELHALLEEGGRQCVLVCPGPDAEELHAPADPAAAGYPDGPPRTLIFVDGTWPQAKGMCNKSPWLMSIPRVVLCSTGESGYEFRKQPAQGCLSTLEAVAEALLALEGPRGPTLKARRAGCAVCACLRVWVAARRASRCKA